MSEESPEIQIITTPRAQTALNELQTSIAAQFPRATFAVQKGYDPTGIFLVATVDADETDDVYEVVADRLIDIQVEDGIPIYVNVQRPIARVLAEIRERQSRRHFVSLQTG